MIQNSYAVICCTIKNSVRQYFFRFLPDSRSLIYGHESCPLDLHFICVTKDTNFVVKCNCVLLQESNRKSNINDHLLLRIPYYSDFVNDSSLYAILFIILNLLKSDNVEILISHAIIVVVFDLMKLLILLIVHFFLM